MQKNKIQTAMLPIALACLALLASCGGGEGDTPPPTYASRYPTLAAHASMDEEDFERYLLNAGRGTDITQETIKSLSVGASIDSAASTYNLRPIFDLGRLKEDNRLSVDTTRSQQKTELKITSNKTASSTSSQTTIDGSASGSYAGFKAAAAYHQANAWKNTQSDGSISVQMVSANTNNIAAILSSGFSDADNLTPYLIGTKLTDAQLSSDISVAEGPPTSACGGKTYIAGVAVNRYKLADTEPYANMQLLTRMESVFTDLRAQHELCADAAIKAQTIGYMTELRRKIVSAIADFYAFNGDSFVSQTTSMNQGIGKGQLSFSNADGNTESQYGASLSAEYQTGAFGGGASGSFQYYKQNGWATAVQNVQVSAESWPAGVADTSAWVSSLNTMLKDQSASLVPPLGSLPKDPGVKPPTPVGPKKEKQEGPPDSAFASYADWKQYQADKKSAKDADVLERVHQRVENEPLVANDKRTLQSSPGNSEYLQFIAELDDLKLRARQPQKPPQAGASTDGNLVRFDKMYVNGFETLPYDAVIPQLRPKLDIPGVSKAIGSFPQLMEMMLTVEKLGKLDSYLRFLANLSVSNVTPEMSARYHQFFLKSSARAYDLVTLSLGQGTDITPEVLAGYKKAMLGTNASRAESELYKNLQDLDYYDYVVGTLLDPAKGKAWSTAPGGYMPLRWTPDGGTELVTWTGLPVGKDDGVTGVNFSNPNINPLSLYQSAKAIQTPWYPVYIFNQGNTPTLVFVQHFGAYQAIYGARWVVQPYGDDKFVKPSLKSQWPEYQVMGNEGLPLPVDAKKPMREVVAARENSFLEHVMAWDYSVNFPQSGNDPARLSKFNALVVVPKHLNLDRNPDINTWNEKVMRGNSHSVALRFLDNDTLTRLKIENDGIYRSFRPSSTPSAQRLVRRVRDGSVVNVTEEIRGGEAYVMLLPLNAATAGDNLKQAFNYAPERTPMDIVNQNSLGIINKLAVLLQ
ncbi:hypothetical protein [Comamonas testosteroni]|uniref:Uncharacterized protein n=1 Tax=Comamonas testosteroni TaxID=285 RepID=A0A096HA49_COMTE|nr:hypothetical protein [Comamonas testosteroni]KGH25692.1 hypothetical protein P353_24875 [Comamonas testosteroni]